MSRQERRKGGWEAYEHLWRCERPDRRSKWEGSRATDSKRTRLGEKEGPHAGAPIYLLLTWEGRSVATDDLLALEGFKEGLASCALEGVHARSTSSSPER